MAKVDIVPGSSTLKDFFGWINERHAIYLRRFRDQLPKPWTKDKIMQEYKFTNVFRELDKGTIALRKMLAPEISKLEHHDWMMEIADLNNDEHNKACIEFKEMQATLLFNVFWYRVYNRYEHATDIGYVRSMTELEEKLEAVRDADKLIFTSAHLVCGMAGEDKFDTYIEACSRMWDRRFACLEQLQIDPTIEGAFEAFMDQYMIGPFIAYEMASDLRWTPLINASDRLTWANPGPGARRGLLRLGLDSKKHALQSMQMLYSVAGEYLSGDVHHHYSAATDAPAADYPSIWLGGREYPPFEMREIEHCLCEFDKYERVRTGAGRPRNKYDGK